MRRLLFSLSILGAMAGCSDTGKVKGQKSAAATEVVSETDRVEGTSEPSSEQPTEVPAIQQSEPKVLKADAPEVNQANKAQKAEQVDEAGKHTAMPAHNSPEQTKIDSIKAAKQKGKK